MLHPIKLLLLWYLAGLATLHSRESPDHLLQQQTQTQQTRATPSPSSSSSASSPSSCWAHLKTTWRKEGLPAAGYVYFDKTGPCRRRVGGKQEQEQKHKHKPPQRTDLQHSIIHHLVHTFAAPLTLLSPRLRKQVQDFCWDTVVGLGTLLLEWQPWVVAKSMEAWEYVESGEAAAAAREVGGKILGEVMGTLQEMTTKAWEMGEGVMGLMQEKVSMARSMGEEAVTAVLEKTKKALTWVPWILGVGFVLWWMVWHGGGKVVAVWHRRQEWLQWLGQKWGQWYAWCEQQRGWWGERGGGEGDAGAGGAGAGVDRGDGAAAVDRRDEAAATINPVAAAAAAPQNQHQEQAQRSEEEAGQQQQQQHPPPEPQQPPPPQQQQQPPPEQHQQQQPDRGRQQQALFRLLHLTAAQRAAAEAKAMDKYWGAWRLLETIYKIERDWGQAWSLREVKLERAWGVFDRVVEEMEGWGEGRSVRDGERLMRRWLKDEGKEWWEKGEEVVAEGGGGEMQKQQTLRARLHKRLGRCTLGEIWEPPRVNANMQDVMEGKQWEECWLLATKLRYKVLARYLQQGRGKEWQRLRRRSMLLEAAAAGVGGAGGGGGATRVAPRVVGGSPSFLPCYSMHRMEVRPRMYVPEEEAHLEKAGVEEDCSHRVVLFRVVAAQGGRLRGSPRPSLLHAYLDGEDKKKLACSVIVAVRSTFLRELLEVEPRVCVSEEERKRRKKVREEVVGWLEEEEMGGLKGAAAMASMVCVNEVMSVLGKVLLSPRALPSVVGKELVLRRHGGGAATRTTTTTTAAAMPLPSSYPNVTEIILELRGAAPPNGAMYRWAQLRAQIENRRRRHRRRVAAAEEEAAAAARWSTISWTRARAVVEKVWTQIIMPVVTFVRLRLLPWLLPSPPPPPAALAPAPAPHHPPHRPPLRARGFFTSWRWWVRYAVYLFCAYAVPLWVLWVWVSHLMHGGGSYGGWGKEEGKVDVQVGEGDGVVWRDVLRQVSQQEIGGKEGGRK